MFAIMSANISLINDWLIQSCFPNHGPEMFSIGGSQKSWSEFLAFGWTYKTQIQRQSLCDLVRTTAN